MIKRFKKWICKTFGHSFSPVSVIMFNIKITATNAPNRPEPTIKCRRCKKSFNVEELSKEYETRQDFISNTKR